MNTSGLSYVYVSISILLWASTAAIAKLLLQDITNIQLTFYSFIFSLLGLFTILVFQGKLQLIKTYTKKDFFRIACMGILGCYAYYIFLFGALMYAPAQEVFIVNYLWPMMVVIFAIFVLKEKCTFQKIIGLIVSFIGVYFVVTKGELLSFTFSNAKGDILAILGAVSYGLFSVLGKKYNYETFTSMFLYYCFGFVFILITIFIFSSIPKISFIQFIGLAWLGVMTNALAFVFWFKALEYGDTAKIANVVFLTPFLSLVYIYFFVGEHILLSTVLGLFFIVSGIVIQSFKKQIPQKENQ